MADSLYTCPRGHEVNHEGPFGRCQPLRCADPGETGVSSKTRRPPKAIAPPRPEAGIERFSEDVEVAIEAAKLRRKVGGLVVEVAGSEAEAHVAKRLMDLTPAALAELEYQLMTGKDDTRMKIAMDILDRAGFSKKGESTGAGGPVIIIQGGAPKLPWAPAVEGEVVKDDA